MPHDDDIPDGSTHDAHRHHGSTYGESTHHASTYDASAHDDTSHDDDTPPRWLRIGFTVLMVVVAVGWGWLWIVKTNRVVVADPPTFAVEAAAADSLSVRARALLAASLSRLPALSLVDDTADQVIRGAAEILADGEVQLEVWRHDASSDDLLGMLRTRGATLDEAVDRMTAQLASSLGLPPPPMPQSPSQ